MPTLNDDRLEVVGELILVPPIIYQPPPNLPAYGIGAIERSGETLQFLDGDNITFLSGEDVSEL